MNTKISYLYRDADNYKKVNGCVITQMKETEEITEELKVQDQMTWVRAKEQLAAQVKINAFYAPRNCCGGAK